MQTVMFTVAGIFLYLISDWAVQYIEVRMGRRLKYRNVLFFVIIVILASGLFHVVQSVAESTPEPVATKNTTSAVDPMATHLKITCKAPFKPPAFS